MKRTVIICAAAALALAAWAMVAFWPEPDGELPGYTHEHAAYLTLSDQYGEGVNVTFTPRDGQSFSIGPSGIEGMDGDMQDAEMVRVTRIYALNLPALEYLGRFGQNGALENGARPADFGLDPPLMGVDVGDAARLAIGDLNPSRTAYYVHELETGGLYLIDAEIGDRLTLPRSAYIKRQLWPGPAGDRPALAEIAYMDGAGGFRIERYARGDLELPEYRMTAPFAFLCGGDAVRSKVLAGILDIDLDEYVCPWEDRDPDHGFGSGLGERELLLIPDEYRDSPISLTVGGPAPGGGRYVAHGGHVFIDRFGGYGFMDVTPLDLTYGVPFWLYPIGDVKRAEVAADTGVWRIDMDHASNRFTLTAPDGDVIDAPELSARRLFARILNFSVAGDAAGYGGSGVQMTVTLYMADGALHELRFYETVNARMAPVSADGAEPVFACNIKDLQAVLEALELISRGVTVPAE